MRTTLNLFAALAFLASVIQGCALDAPPTTTDNTEENNVEAEQAVTYYCSFEAVEDDPRTESYDETTMMGDEFCTVPYLTDYGYEDAVNGCIAADGECVIRPSDGVATCYVLTDSLCADLNNNPPDGEEICDNGVDDNADGRVDGDDPSCEGEPCDLAPEDVSTCHSRGTWQAKSCVPTMDDDYVDCDDEDVCTEHTFCLDGMCTYGERPGPAPDSRNICCASPTEQLVLGLDSPSELCSPCVEPISEEGVTTDIMQEVCVPSDEEGFEHGQCTCVPNFEENDCCSPHGGAGCAEDELALAFCLSDPGGFDPSRYAWCCIADVIDFGFGFGWDNLCVADFNEFTTNEANPYGLCGSAEICNDEGLEDEDLDFLANCTDPDCATHPACAVSDPVCGEDLDCSDPLCADDPACPDPVEECSNGVDDDTDGLADCDDPDCAVLPVCDEPEEPTEVTLQLNPGWYFQGCTGPPMSAPSYVGCSGGWNSNAGQSISWNPAIENALFTIRNEGGLWPLEAVDCATDEFTFVGATASDIFVDTAAPAALGCTPVCTDPDGDGTPNAPNWVCTGVPE